MIEKVIQYALANEKKIEKLLWDECVHINHMILSKGDALPVHDSNSNVYMILIRGIMSISLNDQETKTYTKGDILNIPEGIKMYVRNEHEEVLEFFVIKAPAPKA